MAKEIQITRVHPLPDRGTSFTWVPYWVFDVIVKARSEGKDWRTLTGEKYQDWLDLLKEAVDEYGDVDFIESRNGYVHKLSHYEVATPEPETEPETK
ncbi:capsid vertex protein [Pantoea phage Phynn]|nr:capsid vertex protein [Pantoea phage Phynn]